MGRSFLPKMLLVFGLAGGSRVAVSMGVVAQTIPWCLRMLGNILPCLGHGGSIRPVWQHHFGMSFFMFSQHFSSFSHYQEVSEPTMLRRVENRGSSSSGRVGTIPLAAAWDGRSGSWTVMWDVERPVGDRC